MIRYKRLERRKETPVHMVKWSSLGSMGARLEGLEPPTRCRESRRTTVWPGLCHFELAKGIEGVLDGESPDLFESGLFAKRHDLRSFDRGAGRTMLLTEKKSLSVDRNQFQGSKIHQVMIEPALRIKPEEGLALFWHPQPPDLFGLVFIPARA